MVKITRVLCSLLLVLVLCPVATWADGSSPMPSQQAPPPERPKTAEELATEHYNLGLRHRDKAWKLEGKMTKAPNEEKRAKLEAKVFAQYESAIKELSLAIHKNPKMHQAYSSLGYARRKTGQYEKSLQAYGTALQLAPDYSEAIEYRAEAYLGLGRLAEAKDAYIRLFSLDRESADTLLAAMKEWVEERDASPGDLSTEEVRSFAGWLVERDELARQTVSLSQQQTRKW